MTEQHRQQLLAKAAKLGINGGQFVMLVKNAELELKFATGISNTDYPDDNGSGFLTQEEAAAESNPPSAAGASGFITESAPDSETTIQQNETPRQDPPNVVFATSGNQFSEIKKLDVSGAMSDVYSAIHLGRRKVIIKRIKPQYRYNKDYVDLFFKEFDNGYSLENSNIVHFYGKGDDNQGPFYYMEYVDGRTLYDFIHVEKNPKPELIRQIMLQILDALKYMHQKQVFHRDLKPENIMLTYKGNNVKIIDFGLAASDSMVDYLQKAGTPKYAAPELMGHAQTADQRSDIYSLGLILIEMFTQRPDRKWMSEIPVELMRTIADKATMKDPADRYQSCDEIIRLLQAGNSNPMPKWLEDKILEYASDGVITRNERQILDKEIDQAGVDRSLAEAMIRDAVDKAITQKRLDEAQRRNGLLVAQKRDNAIAASQKGKSSKSTLFKILLVVIAALLGVLILVNIGDTGQGGSQRGGGAQSMGRQEFSRGEVVYTSSNVNLRQLASKDSKILKTIPKNTPVEVIDIGYYWVEVKVDNKRGYMAKDYLSHTITR